MRMLRVAALLSVLVAAAGYSPARAGTHEVGGYMVITAADLKKMHEGTQELLVIDTLAESAYKQGHIPGAKHFEFPNGTMDPWDKSKTAARSQEEFVALLGVNKDRPLVFYCLDER